MSTPTLTRAVPPLGGFNTTLLRIELMRMLRNRRTTIFTLVFPAAMFFAFGSNEAAKHERAGEGNVSAYILLSMALYGAALIAASAGSTVALERSVGWSRQLLITPLVPVVYILVKAWSPSSWAPSRSVSSCSSASSRAMPRSLHVWLVGPLVTLLCTLTIAALGVFVGYIVPGENAMQILGPGLALLSFLGGVFIPIDQYAPVVRDIAYWTPMYGVAEIARYPLTHELPWYALVNAGGWFLVFIAGAAWRMSKDTSRV